MQKKNTNIFIQRGRERDKDRRRARGVGCGDKRIMTFRKGRANHTYYIAGREPCESIVCIVSGALFSRGYNNAAEYMYILFIIHCGGFDFSVES